MGSGWSMSYMEVVRSESAKRIHWENQATQLQKQNTELKAKIQRLEKEVAVEKKKRKSSGSVTNLSNNQT